MKEKSPLILEGKQLPIMEMFYTLQGEGAFLGTAAYFIRLAGCDVGCVWCDVKESWQADKHPVLSVQEIVKQAASYPARIAVITGGEPVMYVLQPLIDELHRFDFQVNIETSGAHPLVGKPDWVCLSPKKFKAPLPAYYAIADELKIIVYHKSDFAWAEQFEKLVPKNCKLFLQPEWDKSSQMLPLIVDYVKQNPQWRVSLQTHKYMNIP
jgi:organic radical activating enzyme